MRAVFERVEGLPTTRCVQEAFNPAAFSFVYSFGYKPVATLLDLFSEGGTEHELPLDDAVRQMDAGSMDELCVYDAARSGLNRRSDFAYYARWGKIFVYRPGSEIRGFLVGLPGSAWVQLGPLVAEREEEAEALFRHAVAVFPRRGFRTRVMARDRSLVQTLLSLSFKTYCIDLLMVRGLWQPGRCVEAFGIFPEGT